MITHSALLYTLQSSLASLARWCQEEMVDLKFKLGHLQFRTGREVKKR